MNFASGGGSDAKAWRDAPAKDAPALLPAMPSSA